MVEKMDIHPSPVQRPEQAAVLAQDLPPHLLCGGRAFDARGVPELCLVHEVIIGRSLGVAHEGRGCHHQDVPRALPRRRRRVRAFPDAVVHVYDVSVLVHVVYEALAGAHTGLDNAMMHLARRV